MNRTTGLKSPPCLHSLCYKLEFYPLTYIYTRNTKVLGMQQIFSTALKSFAYFDTLFPLYLPVC